MMKIWAICTALSAGVLPASTMVWPGMIWPGLFAQPVQDDGGREHRIVLWEETLGGALSSQVVIGGDQACMNFAGQIAAMTQHEQQARCLSSAGDFLFSMHCNPPNSEIRFNKRVIIPKSDSVCKKAEE